MGAIKERIVAQGHGRLDPSFFAVHSTANPGATAANHASLWSRQPAYAVHLVSDWRECLHTVPYDRLCWQVGNGNRRVEGIEICEATNAEDFNAGINIAAMAVAERLRARGWGTDRLITHHQAAQMWGGSDHTDPDPYFARFGYSWGEFKNLVSSYMDGEDDMTNEQAKMLADINDRVYRMTSMLKALCGLGAEDTSDPKGMAEEIRSWTMGRWERTLRILKGMVGIGQDDTGDGEIETPMHVSLSDGQMDEIAERVAAKLR